MLQGREHINTGCQILMEINTPAHDHTRTYTLRCTHTHTYMHMYSRPLYFRLPNPLTCFCRLEFVVEDTNRSCHVVVLLTSEPRLSLLCKYCLFIWDVSCAAYTPDENPIRFDQQDESFFIKTTLNIFQSVLMMNATSPPYGIIFVLDII